MTSSSVLGGSSDLTIESQLDWRGGRMTGSADTIVAPGATLLIHTPAGGSWKAVSGNRSFFNNSTTPVNWTGDIVYIGSGGTFTNNGTIESNGDQGISNEGATVDVHQRRDPPESRWRRQHVRQPDELHQHRHGRSPDRRPPTRHRGDPHWTVLRSPPARASGSRVARRRCSPPPRSPGRQAPRWSSRTGRRRSTARSPSPA